MGNRRIIGLGADGICLSEQLLDKKIKTPALGFALLHGLLELFEVTRQANQFLSNIAAVRVLKDFAENIDFAGGVS